MPMLEGLFIGDVGTDGMPMLEGLFIGDVQGRTVCRMPGERNIGMQRYLPDGWESRQPRWRPRF